MEYTHYTEEGDEIILEVEYTPGYSIPSKTSGHPDSWYEAEGADLYLDAVFNPAGVDILSTLSPHTIGLIEKSCIKDCESANAY